ncbi:hypothetical protein F444_16224 [Phytophthora nicotianae P1976]|uniref:Uncharacterized protein n=1 Tax=Phytophthora nicotianae P1976 TaxID=1317066 RepID=A0A080ZJ77_PHYNI|nr:hypothetical protein F444_16224 [Phytophthora nicotianae P1976]
MPSSESIVASTRQSLSSFSTVSQEVESSPSTTRVSINNITFRNPQEKVGAVSSFQHSVIHAYYRDRVRSASL